jgi:hypothetical protein
MKQPQTIQALEELGRVRLSKHFFMRDFLYSDITNIDGVPNIPDDPDLAIAAGTRLCEELLEPLEATFGRIAIRSAYRSSAVNGLVRTSKRLATGPTSAVPTSTITPPTSGTAAMRKAAWARPPASWCRGLPTATSRAQTGARWRGGYTTT